MMMNSFLAGIYIIVGTFNGLVTFVGEAFRDQGFRNLLQPFLGISEYIFFFLAVLGVFVLRRGGKCIDQLHRTWTFNPVIFCVSSFFIVVRGIITDPLQGLALLIFTLAGWAWFRRRPR